MRFTNDCVKQLGHESHIQTSPGQDSIWLQEKSWVKNKSNQSLQPDLEYLFVYLITCFSYYHDILLDNQLLYCFIYYDKFATKRNTQTHTTFTPPDVYNYMYLYIYMSNPPIKTHNCVQFFHDSTLFHGCFNPNLTL